MPHGTKVLKHRRESGRTTHALCLYYREDRKT